MRYMHPDEIEEMDFQLNARADYLSEAFGDEARMLEDQARDEMQDPTTYGFATEAGMAQDNAHRAGQRRARAAIVAAHTPVENDDVPF